VPYAVVERIGDGVRSFASSGDAPDRAEALGFSESGGVQSDLRRWPPASLSG